MNPSVQPHRTSLRFRWVATAVVFWVASRSLALTPREACFLLLATSSEAPGDPTQALARGQAVFEAAAALVEHGTGVTLPRNGRQAAIPPRWMGPLTEAFIREYRGFSDPEYARGRKTSAPPIASGNVGHMADHLALLERFGPSIQRHLGIDPASLRLAIVAHDIGKAFLHELMDVYIAHRTEGNFLNRFVLSHEFHSIALIPRVVEGVLREQGIDVASERGRRIIAGVSLQIMEMIRLHNGVHVAETVEAMRQRYPSLTQSEIEGVLNAWWPVNYRNFAARMGVNANYGSTLGGPGAAAQGLPIPTVLNFLDRATLTAPTFPWKIGKQNFGTMGFTADLIHQTFVAAAEGNQVLIRAQAERLRPFLQTPGQNVHELDFVVAAQQFNQNAITFGRRLSEMNQPTNLPAGLTPQELPVTSAERRTSLEAGRPVRSPQFLYYRAGTAEAPQWFRINGTDANNAVTQRRNGSGEWVEVRSGGHPIDAFMRVVVEDGQWTAPPAP